MAITDIQRTYMHRMAGGVGVFVKNDLFSHFNFSVLDRSYDGILCISVVSKETDYSIAIFCTYLPQESSTWGRDATGFYAHLLAEIYTLSEYDSIILCGDLNSRIGKTNDVISRLDNIPQRSPIDQTTNQHRHTFIEFLNDSKFCVLNGRLCSENDDYTSVLTRGKAVVDYICVPHDCYKNCSNFRVISPESLVHRHNLQHLLGPVADLEGVRGVRSNPPLGPNYFRFMGKLKKIQVKCSERTPLLRGFEPPFQKSWIRPWLGPRSKLPDHYFLTFDFSYSYYSIPSDNNTCKEMPENIQKPFIERKYKLNRLPSNFMNSNICRAAFTELINRIELCRENQNNIDLVYDSFCDTLIREMNDSVPYFDCTKPVRKRFKSFKPYWNEELDKQCNEMRLKERAFVKHKGSRERGLALKRELVPYIQK